MKDPINLDDLPIEVLFKYLLRDYKKAQKEINTLKREKSKHVNISLKDIPKSERKEYMIAYFKDIDKAEQIVEQVNKLNNKIKELTQKNRELASANASLIVQLNKSKGYGE